jgi:hypothetical protein
MWDVTADFKRAGFEGDRDFEADFCLGSVGYFAKAESHMFLRSDQAASNLVSCS